jgi:hypothetical protein
MDIIGRFRYIAVKTDERNSEKVIGNLRISISTKEPIRMKVPILAFIMLALLP